MITAATVVGIDASRDWLDGFCFPGDRRFRLANSAEGYELLVAAIREMPGPIKIGFEATGGQEWVLCLGQEIGVGRDLGERGRRRTGLSYQPRVGLISHRFHSQSVQQPIVNLGRLACGTVDRDHVLRAG